ncbi:MAG TPA: Imm21 family immunity protein [Armatimonadota bacterium]|nr:Imm21 family immunity protein [Armatimonadota bacterium]
MGVLSWVESAGGPLIAMPRSVVQGWDGVRPSEDRLVEARFRWKSGGPATDYDRACDVEEYVGVIRVEDVDALVLGEEPLPTAWIELPGRDGGVLVRWVFAEDNLRSEDLPGLDQLHWEPGVEWMVTSSPQMLFDSATPGELLERTNSVERNLRPGRYAVVMADFRPDPLTHMRLHRLTRIG